MLNGADLHDSFRDTDQVECKKKTEEAYEMDIQALRKRLDFMDFSKASYGSSEKCSVFSINSTKQAALEKRTTAKTQVLMKSMQQKWFKDKENEDPIRETI